VAASGPNGRWALVWKISWDTAIDAREFATAYESASSKLPFATRLVSVGDTESIVLHASSTTLLDRIATGL